MVRMEESYMPFINFFFLGWTFNCFGTQVVLSLSRNSYIYFFFFLIYFIFFKQSLVAWSCTWYISYGNPLSLQLCWGLVTFWISLGSLKILEIRRIWDIWCLIRVLFMLLILLLLGVYQQFISWLFWCFLQPHIFLFPIFFR